MKSSMRFWALGLAAVLSACSTEGGGAAPEPPGASPASAPLSEAALQIERAERVLDRGGDSGAARRMLEHALESGMLSPDEERRALLALSRAYEAGGDRERAISLVEGELARHVEDDDWTAAPFEARLRALLMGDDRSREVNLPRDEEVARFAHVLARYFPPESDGTVETRFFLVGGERSQADRVGLLNISGALRAERQADCPLCDDEVSVRQSVHHGDWLLVPSHRAELDSAAIIVSYDLQGNAVPARYETLLPMPVEEIEAELRDGHSFVVAADREAAPPTVLLAAPRTAMLEDLVRALAELDELPREAVRVEVPIDLRPQEIRAAVRAQWRPEGRRCYEDLLTRDAKAGGRMIMSFEVAADGSVQSVELTTDARSLEDAAFGACVERALSAVVLPATGKRTTVRYPIEVSAD